MDPRPDYVDTERAREPRAPFPWALVLSTGALLASIALPSSLLSQVSTGPASASSWRRVAALPAPVHAIRAHGSAVWAVGPGGAAYSATLPELAFHPEQIVIPEDTIPPGATEPDMPPSPIVEDFLGVAFAPDGVTIVGGLLDSDDSTIVSRAPAAARWRRPPPVDAGLLSAVVFSGKNGYAAGSLGLVISDDGGRTWPALVPTDEPLLAVTVAPNGRAWAAGAKGLLLTLRDGRWTATRPVSVESVITAVAFLDETSGALVTDRGELLTTGDGGERWSPAALPAKPPAPLYALAVRPTASAPRFAAAGASGVVLLSNDGRAWTRADLPDTSAAVVSLAFAGDRLLAATETGVIHALD